MADEIDRFLAAYPPDIQALTHRARALVASICPDADETLKVGWKVIWYGFGKKMPDQFAVVVPTRSHVGLGFAHGTDLPDPEGRLEGEGKRMRHVKLRTEADVSDPAVAALLRRGRRGPGRRGARASVRLEDLLDPAAEEAGDPEGQGQAGVVAAGLDRVDGLPRDPQPLGEVALRPAALGPQGLEARLQRYLHHQTIRPRRKSAIMHTPTYIQFTAGSPAHCRKP